jgi:hypothetical protein
VQQAALSQARIQQHLDGQKIEKLIFVSGRVLNIVTKGPADPLQKKGK